MRTVSVREYQVIHYRKNVALNTRVYASFNNALRRTVERAVFDSKPGDVFEFSSRVSGISMCSIRATACSFKCEWHWTQGIAEEKNASVRHLPSRSLRVVPVSARRA